jgi:hypothetical protein
MPNLAGPRRELRPVPRGKGLCPRHWRLDSHKCLEPGSSLILETTALGPSSYKIGRSGAPEGAIGFLGVDVSNPPDVKVAGRAADGVVVAGVIKTAG